MKKPNEVNWTIPTDKISDHFTVKDALFLPKWGIMHSPSEKEKETILNHASNMDKIRDILDLPIVCHCWLRPKSVNCHDSKYHEHDYNQEVKGANLSAHIYGMATDWHAIGYESAEKCQEIREKLVPHLENLNMRMEDKDGAWIHTDSAPVKSKRFFKP